MKSSSLAVIGVLAALGYAILNKSKSLGNNPIESFLDIVKNPLAGGSGNPTISTVGQVGQSLQQIFAQTLTTPATIPSIGGSKNFAAIKDVIPSVPVGGLFIYNGDTFINNAGGYSNYTPEYAAGIKGISGISRQDIEASLIQKGFATQSQLAAMPDADFLTYAGAVNANVNGNLLK